MSFYVLNACISFILVEGLVSSHVVDLELVVEPRLSFEARKGEEGWRMMKRTVDCSWKGLGRRGRPLGHPGRRTRGWRLLCVESLHGK
eukprot:2388981-Amphidinium_carterae.1